MEDCKRHVLIALKNLPPNSLFNIVVFGSRFEKMSVESVKVAEGIQLATEYLTHLDAKLGGTNIYEALRPLYLTAEKNKIPRTIFLFSGLVSTFLYNLLIF